MEQELINISSEIEDVATDCKILAGVEDVRLSIDAISVNVDLPSTMKAKIEKFAYAIGTHVAEGSGKYKNPFHRFSDRFYTTSLKAYLNDLLAWEPTGASAFVCQTGSKRPGSKNTRFAWNPSKCDSVTVAGIVFDGYFNIPPTCLIDATISSIHLAADIPHAKVDAQAFSYPQMRHTKNEFSAGRTMYLGVKSGKTRIVAYDKRQEIKEANGKLGRNLAEIKEPGPIQDV